MRRILVWVGLVAALLSLALAFEFWQLGSELETPFLDPTVGPLDLQISPGMSAGVVAQELEWLGVIPRARTFRWWLWWTDKAGSIQAGEYRFEGPLSPVEIAEIVTRGRVRMYPVTLVEGATRWQIAEAISGAGFADPASALDATEHVELIADLDPEATTLEGYVYPETYLVPAGTTALELIEMAVKRFRDVWTQERQRRADELGSSLREVVILASLIEAETPTAEERPVVSAVFHNRLERGMPLQTDPTVLYAKRLAGGEGRTIYRSDLRRESPYNTYTVRGLPIGPIGSPRAASIDAALHPADVDFLYFVSCNDGTHAFSRTLREHNQMVNQYQR